jgi:hypothetical protein
MKYNQSVTFYEVSRIELKQERSFRNLSFLEFRVISQIEQYPVHPQRRISERQTVIGFRGRKIIARNIF